MGWVEALHTYMDNDNGIYTLKPIKESIHMIRPKGGKHDYDLDIDE